MCGIGEKMKHHFLDGFVPIVEINLRGLLVVMSRCYIENFNTVKSAIYIPVFPGDT